MPALISREQARQAAVKAFMSELDRIIPSDQTKPLKGSKFIEWEDQVERLVRTVAPTVLEQRAALEENAAVEKAGHCPHCGSERVYLEKQVTQPEVISPHGQTVIRKQHCRCHCCGGFFPPQNRDWALPVEAPLTPRAAERLCRESAAQGSFANAARAMEIDWGVRLDPRQVQRWADALGDVVVRRQDREVLAMEEGRHPATPGNDPQLLVIEVDGGRVQTREKDPNTQSHWREDKVCTISTYQPGDGKDCQPVPLVTTHVATMRPCEPFGRLCRLEAERRGLRQADQVLALGDGGNFIDPLLEREFRSYVRIIDWRHAQEHLWDCARAVHGDESLLVTRAAKHLETLLWNGKVKKVIAELAEHARQLGEPVPEEGPSHPKRVLHQNVGYFTKHQDHMNYPDYRRRGWPIGSGVVESGVKQFNKRVKGSDQFWNEPTLEPILALRGLWLSQDQRWDHYWSERTAYRVAA